MEVILDAGAQMKPKYVYICYWCLEPEIMKRCYPKLVKYKKCGTDRASGRRADLKRLYTDWCIDPDASSYMCRGRSAFVRLLTDSEGDIVLVNGDVFCSEQAES